MRFFRQRWGEMGWTIPAFVLLVVAMLAAWLAYQPGTSGPFLFDDYSNLPSLADFGPIHHFWQVIAWITSGFAGPTGRPVALASFLIDAQDWPAPAEIFKRTNILLHLMNGAALAGLLFSVTQGSGLSRRRSVWVAVIAASVWLLHPYWVSTTLYVIQRMTMLAALFVFAGLWSYAHGRLALMNGRRRAGYLWMSGGLIAGTGLAVFSKENGALLPLFAWLLEGFVFDREGRALDRYGRGFVWWRRIFVIAPSLLVLAYLAWLLQFLFSGQWFGREFSPYERLLTESRIMWGYLAAIWLPGTHLTGLFNDDIRISTGLLHPLSTIFALMGLLGLGVVAFLAKVFARSPFYRSVGLAVAFFLVGHLLESTWLPLELSFEHRNYLPAGLMFLPLSMYMVRRYQSHRTAITAVVVILLLGLALLTMKRADLWGKPFQQALVWAQEHPNSPRAQSYLANFWSGVGNNAEAIRLLDRSLKRYPHSLLLLANRALAACAVGSAPPELGVAIVRMASQGRLDLAVTGYQFDRLLLSLSNGCKALGAVSELRLIDAALSNPYALRSPDEIRSLLHRRAMYWLAHDNPQSAFRDYLQALRQKNLQPGVRLRFAIELVSAGHSRLALRLLDSVPSPLANISGWSMAAIHDRWLRYIHYFRDAEKHLRAELVNGSGRK